MLSVMQKVPFLRLTVMHCIVDSTHLAMECRWKVGEEILLY